jgi:hypothetical protein
LECLTAQWADRDVQTALAWARQVPDENQRAGLLGRVVFALAQSDPEAAANVVAGELPAGAAQDRACLSVAHQWALHDPASAAVWISRFPEGPLLEEAVRNLVGVWNLSDSQAAEQWLASFP